VLSTQVLEHLHPDDLSTHLRAALKILQPGGKYIVATPHKMFGPADLSAVFGKPVPMGMHLREYLHGDLALALRQAGFEDIRAVYLMPQRLRRVAPVVWESSAFETYVVAVERFLQNLTQRTGLPIPRLALRLLLLNRDVFLTALKPKVSSKGVS
jgi:hypothetical protein